MGKPGGSAGDLFAEMAARLAPATFDAAMERRPAATSPPDPHAVSEQTFVMLDPALPHGVS
ncbi:hypothetical protein [Actinoplanes sp. NBRC 101535]|uniref:hypothetical protein n=1 Tax=Actinoplanes sp. NBRC 101535 TaxID=3032196 RepID=UPI0024A05D42|nr:hypothetical protein [Actinoplanes sp. NBRC 101535]GLY07980.1 hypothetical protein Acsp01_83590 [Actinoplanes sp. NBRC 101535]